MSRKAFKTRIEPTEEQAERLRHWGRIRRGIYNWARSIKERAYEEEGKNLSKTEVSRMFTERRGDGGFSHWADAPRKVGDYALKDLFEAYQGFFRRVSAGESPGHPKRRYERHGPTLSVQGYTCDFSGSHVEFPKMRSPGLKLVEPDYIPTGEEVSHKRVTIKKDASHWVISSSAVVGNPIDEDRLAPEEERPDTLAVHPGVRVWVAMREAARAARTEDLPMDRVFDLMSRADRQHRQLSRRSNGSGGWERARTNLARTYQQLRHLRSDQTHKLTAKVAYDIRPQTLIIQDWNVADLFEQGFEDMPRKIERKINRRMANANMGEIYRQLKYKSEWAGVDVHVVDPEVEASMRCSACGHVYEELGGQSTFDCPECPFEVDREINALNNYYLEHEEDRTMPVEDYEG